MMLVNLCVTFVASNLESFPKEAIRLLPVELRSAVLDHLLHAMQLQDVDFSPLMGMDGQMPVIDTLDLASSPYESAKGPSASLLRHIGSCAPTLKDLRLKNCSVLTDKLVETLLDALPRLEVLHLSGAMHITDLALQHIQKRVANQLKYLEVNTPNRLTSPALTQLLASAPNLRGLSVNAARFTDSMITAAPRGLSTLEINNCHVTDKIIEYISEGTGTGIDGMSELQSLTLRGCLVDGSHFNKLVDHCTKLEELAIATVSKVDPSRVTILSKLTSLRLLDLYSSWSILPREPLEAIIQGCPLLERLSVAVDVSSTDPFLAFASVSNGLRELTLGAYTPSGTIPVDYCDAKHIIQGCPLLLKLQLHNVVLDALPLALHGLHELRSLNLSFVEDPYEIGDEANSLPKEELEARLRIRAEHTEGLTLTTSTSLRKLILSHAPERTVLTAEAMTAIVKGSPKFQVLKIVEGHLDIDAVLEAVAAASPPLRKVQLYNLPASNNVVATLLKSAGQKIAYLDLRRLAHLTDDCLEAIVRHCGQLRNLYLSPGVFSRDALSRLRQGRPHCDRSGVTGA